MIPFIKSYMAYRPYPAPRLSPKMAVPTRTMVAPSSMATSKSWLMPMESSCMETLGSFRAAMSPAN